MSWARGNTQKGYSTWERLRHSLLLLILLDLFTLGFYGLARHYLVHAVLSQKAGHRPFSPAFLHILVVLSLLLWVLRYSRENMPGDLAVIMTRLGAGLLGISVLLIFRRSLHFEFQLKVLPFPLAIFGFWYLQYAINRGPREVSGIKVKDRWPLLAAVILLAFGLSLTRAMLKHYHVTDTAMEPTLSAGDYVLAEQLSFTLGPSPQRGELWVHPSLPPQGGIQVKRVLGLPGDRLRFHGDHIEVNGQTLSCQPPEAVHSTGRRLFVCEIEGRSFSLQRRPKGTLMAVEGEFEVPAEHYFMIGDNLDHAVDSRSIGSVPAWSILGRARWRTISYRLGESLPWDRWFHRL